MLEQLNNSSSPVCTVYAPLSLENITKGSCGMYRHRGLICRLFGYGASKDKYGQLRLVTCKLIKEQQAENVQKAVELIQNQQPGFFRLLQKTDPDRLCISQSVFTYQRSNQRSAGSSAPPLRVQTLSKTTESRLTLKSH